MQIKEADRKKRIAIADANGKMIGISLWDSEGDNFDFGSQRMVQEINAKFQPLIVAGMGSAEGYQVVIDALKAKGIRDQVTVLVGGAPVNEEFARSVGADAYCRDAAIAVETAKDWIKRKHNQRV